MFDLVSFERDLVQYIKTCFLSFVDDIFIYKARTSNNDGAVQRLLDLDVGVKGCGPCSYDLVHWGGGEV